MKRNAKTNSFLLSPLVLSRTINICVPFMEVALITVEPRYLELAYFEFPLISK